jgi:copper(I)-binding protein
MVAAACGGDDEETTTEDETSEAATEETESDAEDSDADASDESDEGDESSAEPIEIADGVTVSGPWARTSPMMANAGAAYFEISSEEELVIVSASVPEDVAGKVELHETVPMEGGDDASMEDMDDESTEEGDDSMDDESMEGGDDSMEGGHGDMPMTMVEVESIVVPAGGSAVLEPGGIHVMLLELPDGLEVGETFDLTLVTETGDELIVPIEVRDEAP